MDRMKNQRGFSYIEVVVSLFIFLMVFGLALEGNSKMFHMSANSTEREQMLYVAKSMIEGYKYGGKEEALLYANNYEVTLNELPYADNLTKILITVKLENKEKPMIEMSYLHLDSDNAIKGDNQ